MTALATPPEHPLAQSSILLTVPSLFFASAERFPDSPCLGTKVEKHFRYLSYREFAQSVLWLRASLRARGIGKGDRLALMSPNRPEWPLWDLAALSLGAVVVPIYPTLTPKQVHFILSDCGASFLAIADRFLLDPLPLSALPSLREVFLFDADEKPALSIPTAFSKDLLEEGKKISEGSEGSEELSEKDLATIVYTSGTTGDPKGVMLSHENLASNARALVEYEKLTSLDSCLSFLPLSHAFERMAHFMFFTSGGAIAYAENVNSIVANLFEVKPTIVISVPRVFEKVRSRMLENMLSASWLKKNIFFWALRNGRKARQERINGKGLSLGLSCKLFFADLLVFKKARRAFGGRMRFFVSGGAPLLPEVGEFFEVLGFEILEGYGLTETSPVAAANQVGRARLGTVGTVLPGVEVRLAEDGEIAIKGPNVMMGYYNRPDLTEEVLRDGWFSTGDIGTFDEKGFLKIVDRKKEILVMSNGKNIAPQPIENALKKSKYISMAMVVGDGKNYLTALLVPNLDPLLRYARKNGMISKDSSELLKDERIRVLFREEVDRFTEDFARFEKIKDFALLAEEFTQEKNELTPTLKFKRQNIILAYSGLIEPMYGK